MKKAQVAALVEAIVGFVLFMIGLFGAADHNSGSVVCMLLGAPLFVVGLVMWAPYAKKDRCARMNAKMESDIRKNMEIAREIERTQEK